MKSVDGVIETRKIKIKQGMRSVFVAPPGFNVCVSDYASQELRVAAAASGDKGMLAPYFLEISCPKKIRPDTGEEYDNPETDLHLVAALGIFPKLMQLPEWERLSEAKKREKNGKNYRAIGKLLNFGVIYGAQATRVQEEVGGELDEAEFIIAGYFAKFSGLKAWLDTQATLAKYQKWVQDSVGRKYFIAESNAKGSEDENTWVRKACNALIQGTSATMSKRAAWYVLQAYEKLNDYYCTRLNGFNRAELVAVIHDEIVSYVPGDRKLIDITTDNKGYSKLIYECDELSWQFARVKQECMERAMNEILCPLIPDGIRIGKAEPACGSSWAVK